MLGTRLEVYVTQGAGLLQLIYTTCEQWSNYLRSIYHVIDLVYKKWGLPGSKPKFWEHAPMSSGGGSRFPRNRPLHLRWASPLSFRRGIQSSGTACRRRRAAETSVGCSRWPPLVESMTDAGHVHVRILPWPTTYLARRRSHLHPRQPPRHIPSLPFVPRTTAAEAWLQERRNYTRCLNKSPLQQTDPRDALRYAHRVVDKGGRPLW